MGNVTKAILVPSGDQTERGRPPAWSRQAGAARTHRRSSRRCPPSRSPTKAILEPSGDQVGRGRSIALSVRVGQRGPVGVDDEDSAPPAGWQAPLAGSWPTAANGPQPASKHATTTAMQPRDVTAHGDLLARATTIGGDRASKSAGAGAPHGRPCGRGQLRAGGRRHVGLGRARGEGEREAGAPPLGAARRVDGKIVSPPPT